MAEKPANVKSAFLDDIHFLRDNSPAMHLPQIIFHTTHPAHVDQFIPFARRTNNPDIIEINSAGEGITAEDIRQLLYSVHEQPFFESHKIYILYQAESMNSVVQNALLKMLEEPRVHIQCILVTSTPSQLLPTIRSRCILIRDELQEDASAPQTPQAPTYHELTHADLISIALLPQQCATRPIALEYVTTLLQQAHHSLSTNPSLTTIQHLRVLQQAHGMLYANTQVPLVLRWMGLRLSGRIPWNTPAHAPTSAA